MATNALPGEIPSVGRRTSAHNASLATTIEALLRHWLRCG